MGCVLMTRQNCEFEELAHTAEVGLRVRAPTAAGLFACAARGMFALLGAETNTDFPGRAQRVSVVAGDIEVLLVEWLSDLLYLFEITGQIYIDCEISTLTSTQLEAHLIGRPSITPLHGHIKAVTYHDLSVRQTEDGWEAVVVFDI